MQYLVTGSNQHEAATGLYSFSEFFSGGGEDDPVVPAVDQSDDGLMFHDLLPELFPIRLQSPECGPPGIEIISDFFTTDIVVHKFVDTRIDPSKAFHEMQDPEKPARFPHGKGKELIPQSGLCSQPVPAIHF